MRLTKFKERNVRGDLGTVRRFLHLLWLLEGDRLRYQLRVKSGMTFIVVIDSIRKLERRNYGKEVNLRSVEPED